MGKLQIRRGATVPTLLPGEPFLDNNNLLHCGKNNGSGNQQVSETGATIKTKLEALTGDARLDASAVKGLPEGGGSATIYAEFTYAQAMAAMTAGTLVPGTMYKITDRGDRGLFFLAITNTQFAATGTRLMLCPAKYDVGEDAFGNNWIGVWNATKTAVIGDLAIWGGRVWKNLTAAIGTATDDVTLDDTNWVLIPKYDFSNNEYIEMIFGVQFDWTNDWICKQLDDKGNVFGVSALAEHSTSNPVDYSDWNMPGVVANECIGISNNTSLYIFGNQMPNYMIMRNITPVINLNKCTGICDNVVLEISNNSNLGSICNCSGQISIVYNIPSIDNISGLFTQDVTEEMTDKKGTYETNN